MHVAKKETRALVEGDLLAADVIVSFILLCCFVKKRR